ncbi:MAG TPA: ABC-2 family transporter protein [Roseiflexaceae bacterium]|nr:ABC-2 family transporter protein [Roseiflexaceae bacterium]
MKHSASNLPAYIQIVNLWFQMAYTYRVNLAMELVGLLLKIFLLKVVWTAVYAGRDVVDGVELRHVISFVTLANLQMWLIFPMLAWLIQERIREGQIAIDLARPVPFLGQLLANQVGATAAFAPFLLIALPLALIAGGMEPPASASAALLYLVSMVLAYIVTALMGMLMGLIGFWTLQTGGIQAIYDFVSLFFAGALVPLWFFPPLLRHIADWLPFQAQAFIPLSLYMGQAPPQGVAGALGLQLFWVAALFGIAWLVWQRAMRRVIIQGG